MLNYDKKFQEFKNGKITEEEWKEYCTVILNKLLENNKEVFKRLKFN